MSDYSSDIPMIDVPFVGIDGCVSKPWLMLLIQLWRRTGSERGTTPPNVDTTLADILASLGGSGDASSFPGMSDISIPVVGSSLDSASEFLTGISSTPDVLSEMLFSPQTGTDFTRAPAAVAVGPSPFTIKASYRQAVHIFGGTVSSLVYGRGTSNFSIGIQSPPNLVELSQNDTLTITYTTAPTSVYIIPR
jgi:hypothetical protein